MSAKDTLSFDPFFLQTNEEKDAIRNVNNQKFFSPSGRLQELQQQTINLDEDKTITGWRLGGSWEHKLSSTADITLGLLFQQTDENKDKIERTDSTTTTFRNAAGSPIDTARPVRNTDIIKREDETKTDQELLITLGFNFRPWENHKFTIGYLQIASPLTPLQETLTQLCFLLALGVPLGIVAISLTGWFLGGLAMQPIYESYERLHRFTAYASHELRTPLAKILSHSQLGLMSLVETESETRSRLQIIIKTTKGISNLVSDLLFLARHEGELNRQFFKQTDLVELLQTLAEEQTVYCEDKELIFKTDFPSEFVKISIEPDLLRQAVLNY